MANPKLIVMLTWHDRTVDNALEIFEGAKDASATGWGCKDVGIEHDKLVELFKHMKAAGKETYLESLSVTESEGIEVAKLAVEIGADNLMGGVYYDSVATICKENNIGYAPFIGLDMVDTRLRGTVEEIVADAKRVEALDTTEIAISGFRYVSGDPVELISAVGSALEKPLILAGGVNSYERLDILKEIKNLEAFTIGGAFFESKFGETFSDQIEEVCGYMG